MHPGELDDGFRNDCEIGEVDVGNGENPAGLIHNFDECPSLPKVWVKCMYVELLLMDLHTVRRCCVLFMVHDNKIHV